MLRPIAAAGCLLVATATSAFAQAADFPGQLQPTVTINELLVRQIREAMPNNDLVVVSQQAVVTLGTGEDLQEHLLAALHSAPDDAARSRIEGVLTHTQAAVESLRMAGQEATLDATRGRLEQARGEAQEGLDELRPFVVGLAQPALLPAELPVAGSLDYPEVGAWPFVGGLLIIVGFGLRLAARPR